MSTPVGWRWKLPSDTKWQFTDGPEKPRLGLPTSFEAAAIKEPVYAARSVPEAGKAVDPDGLELAEHWMERAENAEIEAADLSRKLEEHQDAEDKAAREMATVIQDLRNRATAAERKLGEAREALEPFYVVAKTLPDPRLINDEAPGVMARHAPGFKEALGKLVLGDFRRVFWLMEKP